MTEKSIKSYHLVGHLLSDEAVTALRASLKDPCNASAHPQAVVNHEGHGVAFVDEDIAHLILWAWRSGIKTRYSCQGDPRRRGPRGHAYIMFGDAKSLETFLDRVSSISSIWPHICGTEAVLQKIRGRKRKVWGPHPDNWDFHVSVPDLEPGHALEPRYTVYFPYKHINLILAEMSHGV